MARNIDRLARRLGARVVGRVPEYSAGAFGVALLAKTLKERLEPSTGKRPGRPSNPNWRNRPKVPMSGQTEERLKELARLLSDEERQVSPMQVAAQILEEASASYFRQAGAHVADAYPPAETQAGAERAFHEDQELLAQRFPALAKKGRLAELHEWRIMASRTPRVFPCAA